MCQVLKWGLAWPSLLSFHAFFLTHRFVWMLLSRTRFVKRQLIPSNQMTKVMTMVCDTGSSCW